MRRRYHTIVLGLSILAAPASASEVSTKPLRTDCTHFEEFHFLGVSMERVAGIVTKSSGNPSEPFPGVQLELLDTESAETVYLLSGEDGSFSFGELPSRRFHLRTCMPGFDVAEVEIEVRGDAAGRLLQVQLGPSEAGFTTAVRLMERK